MSSLFPHSETILTFVCELFAGNCVFLLQTSEKQNIDMGSINITLTHKSGHKQLLI